MNQAIKIPVQEIIDQDTVRAAVLAEIGCAGFELPEADVHVIPQSGGVDSATTGLVMSVLFPTIKFRKIFTDTGVETYGTREALDRIEQATGQPIERVYDGESLFDVVEGYGGFLPSARARYCTTAKKIMPFLTYMDSLHEEFGADAKIAVYVGIRADEPERTGAVFSDDTVESYFPLQALGLDKRAVFSILTKTIGVPHFYRKKSRSGCGICIFGRRSELIDQWQQDPKTVAKAAELEKLSEEATAKLSDLPALLSERLGIGRNHLAFPMPGNIFDNDVLPWERARDVAAKTDKSTDDMFGGVGKRLFCAVEMTRFWDGFKWQQASQEFITYSTSLGGLKMALKFFWKHRLDVREVVGCTTEESLRDDIHVAIFEVEVDDYEAQLAIEREGAYTWQSDGTPLLEIRKVHRILENILLSAEIQRMKRDDKLPNWDREVLEVIGDKDTSGGGQIFWANTFKRPMAESLRSDDDINNAPVPCVQCAR